MKLFILLIIMAYAASASAQVPGVEYQWKMKRDKQGIQIFTTKVPGSKFKAVRGVMIVKGNLSSLVALVQDGASCSQWAALCKESRVHKKVSASEYYVYVYNDVPFPAADRDVLSHVTWHQEPTTLKVSMTSIPTQGVLPKTKAVRIEEGYSQWHFTPLDDGKILVESFGHINPNGETPAWLTNRLLVKTPYKTMKKMRELIESGAYNHKTVSFVTEP